MSCGDCSRAFANGNLLTDNLNTYTWDANWGTLSTASTGATTVTATYDALGRMVENSSGGSYQQFVYGPLGKIAICNGQTLVKGFMSLPGGAKAIYTSSGLAYYRHSDWLGSSRLTSTATSPTSMYSSSAYAPFGEQYATAGSADASFTGQDQNTLSNLYDFLARRQSPSQGRWISPDPAGRGAVTLTNPQSWNRYAYVNNNPLALVDPSGEEIGSNVCASWNMYCLWQTGPSGGGTSASSPGGGNGGGDNSGDDTTTNNCNVFLAGIGVNTDNSNWGALGDGPNGGIVGMPFSDLSSNGLMNTALGAQAVASLAGLDFSVTGMVNGAVAENNAATVINMAAQTGQSLTLYVQSGTAQAVTSAYQDGLISQQALGSISGIVYLSPGTPLGTPTTMGLPEGAVQTYWGGGGSVLSQAEDLAVATIDNGTATPGYTYSLDDCGHDGTCQINSGQVPVGPSDCSTKVN